MENLALIKISDIDLASALLCLGFDINGMDDSNPKRVVFYFIESDEVEEAIDNYWRGAVLVNPKEMANSRREILSRIHGGRG